MQQNISLDRRNIFFQSADSGVFMSGLVFFHQMTILVAFIQKLFDSAIVVSLVPAILFIGYNLPGLFTTRLAERRPFRKPFIVVFGFIQRMCILGLVLSIFLLDRLGPHLTAVLVLICYSGFAFMGGVYNPAWIDFCAKTIPLNFRARTNAFRSLIAGVGGILAPLLISVLLTGFAFPFNYQATIFIGFVLLFVSFTSFLMIKEQNPSPPVRLKRFGEYMASLNKVLKSDANFARFLLSQVLLSVSECGAALYTYYAISRFGVGDEAVVLYTLFYNLSFLVSGFILGFIGDKFGNLQVLRIGALGSFLALLLAIIFPSPVILFVIFALVGININARLNSFQVFITEFGDDKNRIRYSSLATAIGAASFGLMPLLGGILRETFQVSFAALFIIGAVFALLAFLSFVFLVKDPRNISRNS